MKSTMAIRAEIDIYYLINLLKISLHTPLLSYIMYLYVYEKEITL